MIRSVILLALGLLVAVTVYVRLAPVDVHSVHTQAAPQPPGDYPSEGGFIAVRQMTASPVDVLTILQSTLASAARTQVLAGSPEEGMITFETRSKVFGFPDYTTASILPADPDAGTGPLLMLNGRLRFGKSDLGVNQARIKDWLAALGPLTVPLDSATSDE